MATYADKLFDFDELGDDPGGGSSESDPDEEQACASAPVGGTGTAADVSLADVAGAHDVRMQSAETTECSTDASTADASAPSRPPRSARPVRWLSFVRSTPTQPDAALSAAAVSAAPDPTSETRVRPATLTALAGATGGASAAASAVAARRAKKADATYDGDAPSFAATVGATVERQRLEEEPPTTKREPGRPVVAAPPVAPGAGVVGKSTLTFGVSAAMAELIQQFSEEKPSAPRREVRADSDDDYLLDDYVPEVKETLEEAEAREAREEAEAEERRQRKLRLPPEPVFFGFRGPADTSVTTPEAPPSYVKAHTQTVPNLGAGLGKNSIVAFGLNDVDAYSKLVRGSSPHIPIAPPLLPAADPAELPLTEAKKDPVRQEEEKAEDLGLHLNFTIRGEVLPMCVEREDMTPQDIADTWEKAWGCRGGGRLKFEAPAAFPSTSGSKWYHPRNDTAPLHPEVVRLEGPGAVLDAVALALRRRGTRRS